jgi:hypothetical protein
MNENSTTCSRDVPCPRTRIWAIRAAGGTGGQHPPRTSPSLLEADLGWGGDEMRDAQADVPSAGRPRAQLAFKNSMIHGILQFTPSIAFCYVLHRCESLDIRCRQSYWLRFQTPALRRRGIRGGGGGYPFE